MNRLKIIFEEIPDYLKDKSTLITQVMFVSIFGLVFINIYAPFNATTWTEMSRLEFFFSSSVMILIGMLGIVISKLIFFLIMGRIRMSYLIFGLWHVAEIVLIATIYLVVDLVLLKSGMELVDRYTSLLFILAIRLRLILTFPGLVKSAGLFCRVPAKDLGGL